MNAHDKANIALVQRYFEEGMNQGNVALIDELVSDDYCEHVADSAHAPGRDSLKQAILALRRAMPDLRYRIDAIIASGENVEVYATSCATLGGAASRPARMRTLERHVLQIRDGRIVAHWNQNPARVETWSSSTGWRTAIV